MVLENDGIYVTINPIGVWPLCIYGKRVQKTIYGDVAMDIYWPSLLDINSDSINWNQIIIELRSKI